MPIQTRARQDNAFTLEQGLMLKQILDWFTGCAENFREILVAIQLIVPKDLTLNLVGMEEASETEPPMAKKEARVEAFTTLINQDTEPIQIDNENTKKVVSIAS
eukprot:9914525-Ditylum_brightwellii.AAC.1